MRRRLLLAAALLPLPIAALSVAAPGCSADELENICGFLKDADSCVRAFHVETAGRCGALGAGSAPKGSFASRETLDVCFLDDGGQVVFDPPLDLTAFPLTSLGWKRLDAQAAECGSATFSGQFSYSVTVNPCTGEENDAGISACDDGSGASGAKTSVVGGTIAVATPDGRDTVDVACADGTKHHFNRLDTGKCAGHAQLVPRAEIESSAGAQPPPEADAEMLDPFSGFVRFRVYYPPIEANEDAQGLIAEGTQADVVEYFDCTIPPSAPLCFNGVKDTPETDVDCGGSLCDARCAEGQSCVRNDDCKAPTTCKPDEDGFRKCQP